MVGVVGSSPIAPTNLSSSYNAATSSAGSVGTFFGYHLQLLYCRSSRRRRDVCVAVPEPLAATSLRAPLLPAGQSFQ